MSSPNQTTIATPARPARVAVIIATITTTILLVGGLVLAFLWLRGIVVINTSGGEKVRVVSQACDGNLINTYNQLYTTTNRDTRDREATKLGQAIDAVAGHDQDPNCVFMKYQLALFGANGGEAEKWAQVANDLAGQGRYATNQLAGIHSVETMQNTVRILKGGPQSGGVQSTTPPAGRG